MRGDPYLALIAVFVPFSLTSIGGGPSVFAGIQHQAVDVHHWVSAREFVDLFAISRAAPGPGSMLVTLIGWKVAGWWGALVATPALFVLSSLLCYGVARVWTGIAVSSGTRRWSRGLRPLGRPPGWGGFGVSRIRSGASCVGCCGRFCGDPCVVAAAAPACVAGSWRSRFCHTRAGSNLGLGRRSARGQACCMGG